MSKTQISLEKMTKVEALILIYKTKKLLENKGFKFLVKRKPTPTSEGLK